MVDTGPQQIDRYEIRSEIGRGGMAIVYLAWDTQTQREVALKMLPQEYLHNRQYRARFQREIEILVAFRHVAVVPIYGFGQFQGQPYLVMAYMSGGSLEDRIREQGSLTVAEAASLMERIAPALEAAHRQGIIHRDLKPSNILFDELGQAYIADFGIARLAEQAGMTELTGSMLIGTPAYMSPEQAGGDKTLDGRSDVYAMGVVTFQMLTGELPYKADTPIKVALQHISKPIPNILDSNPRLPRGMKKVMTRVLTKEREKRYQTAREFAHALASLAQASPRRAFLSMIPPWVWVVLLVALFLAGIWFGVMLASGIAPVSRTATPTFTLQPTNTASPTHTHTLSPSATPTALATSTPRNTVTSAPIDRTLTNTLTPTETATIPLFLPSYTPTFTKTSKPADEPTITPKPDPTVQPPTVEPPTIQPPDTSTPTIIPPS